MIKMYTIYRAFHKDTGKSYVGFDSAWPKRKYAHKHKSKTDDYQYFHNAIRKYGWESFDWEVLYSSEDKEHCLLMEKHFIREYNCFGNGFNLTLGGEGTFGWIHTDETKLKISTSNKGKKLSDEHKKLLSEKHKGKISPNKGRKFSEETKLKMSASKLGKKRDEETKKKIAEKLLGRVSPNKGKKRKKQEKQDEERTT